MAVWQFNIKLVPEKKVILKYNKVPEYIDLDLINDSSFWNDFIVSESSLEQISEVLPPVKSWSGDIKQYGHSDESCLEIFFENDIINEIIIKLDLRNITNQILTLILNFASENNTLLLSEKGKVIKPTLNLIIEEIKKSNAFSFISDSNAFLDNITDFL